MRHKYFWTHGQDTQIRRRCTEGATWKTIARELALPIALVVARAHRIDAPLPPPDFVPPPDDPDREPLPAGHPATWDAITAGTVLEGEVYPLPYFPR